MNTTESRLLINKSSAWNALTIIFDCLVDKFEVTNIELAYCTIKEFCSFPELSAKMIVLMMLWSIHLRRTYTFHLPLSPSNPYINREEAANYIATIADVAKKLLRTDDPVKEDALEDKLFTVLNEVSLKLVANFMTDDMLTALLHNPVMRLEIMESMFEPSVELGSTDDTVQLQSVEDEPKWDYTQGEPSRYNWNDLS